MSSAGIEFMSVCGYQPRQDQQRKGHAREHDEDVAQQIEGSVADAQEQPDQVVAVEHIAAILAPFHSRSEVKVMATKKRKSKKKRTAAQRAAFRKMIAALHAKRNGRKSRRKKKANPRRRKSTYLARSRRRVAAKRRARRNSARPRARKPRVLHVPNPTVAGYLAKALTALGVHVVGVKKGR